MKILRGLGVSAGVAVGPAHVIFPGRIKVTRTRITPEEIPAEIRRLEEAIQTVFRRIEDLEAGIPEGLGEVRAILEAQRYILADPSLREEVAALIREGLNAEWALLRVLKRYQKAFQELPEEYFRERFRDLEGLVEMVISALSGEENARVKEPAIIVAQDLTPADTVSLTPANTLAFVTEGGSRTSHTAIMARSLGIPAVVAVKGLLEEVSPGDWLAVDGTTGEVILGPGEEIIREFRERARRFEALKVRLHQVSHLPAETRDGRRLALRANLDLPEEVSFAREYGAEGVGLFRTEYLYVSRRELPSEDLLFETYRRVVEALAPHPVTIRTLDIGGDKFASVLSLPEEINPALGLRAIRLCLKEEGLFRTQLRAILRASAYGKVKIMFPMISGVTEFLRARNLVGEIQQELAEEGIPFDPDLKIGAMIEVPSAVAVADLLAQEADFFSIGTNDLIQYTLAIDRGNQEVAELYEPLHPAVLRFIRQTVEAGHRAGIPVALCGEMAGELLYVPVLVGLGLDELSMNPQSLPEIKLFLRELSYEECREAVEELLKLTCQDEVKEALSARFGPMIRRFSRSLWSE
ncbi:phosphoenolpyruvate--protein phosphotransferase [Thermosulfurimonas marina]|uniref:Phosphoenolpyruvate-protein phosphotransferase n=1 Tax=Thermosulfurimonas marina TaxID=2047767 RepID=A0A6H1WSF0_9BACT|nr:phosphoenolpyruvate--protein phosphotransferase [Thermosulfurimonas marina]QJA06123.1 phosphoenolpyruvate--protein phosphotransferase [Thermosulfurimonas marina]